MAFPLDQHVSLGHRIVIQQLSGMTDAVPIDILRRVRGDRIFIFILNVNFYLGLHINLSTRYSWIGSVNIFITRMHVAHVSNMSKYSKYWPISDVNFYSAIKSEDSEALRFRGAPCSYKATLLPYICNLYWPMIASIQHL